MNIPYHYGPWQQHLAQGISYPRNALFLQVLKEIILYGETYINVYMCVYRYKLVLMMSRHGTNCTGVMEVSEICGRGQRGTLSHFNKRDQDVSILMVIL